MLFFEICESFKNTFFEENLKTNAPENITVLDISSTDKCSWEENFASLQSLEHFENAVLEWLSFSRMLIEKSYTT